jgi:cytochrome P450
VPDTAANEDYAGAALDTALLIAFTTPEGQADPYPHYAVVREATPAHLASIGPLVLTRYDDCLQVLRDPRFGQADVDPAATLGLTPEEFTARFPRAGEIPPSLLGLNPPDHTRLRGLVSRAFTPRRVEGLRPEIMRLADELLEPLDGVVDAISSLALQLPMLVIGELLGVPRAQLDHLQPYVRAAVGTLDVRTPSVDEFAASHEAGLVVREAFAELIAARRADPQDDLLSDLVHVEEAGDQLREAELVSLVLLLFGAGFETTTNLIGNGLRALLLHPAEMARLRADRSLLKTAIEEMLRWDSPVQVTGRNALEPAVVLGVPVAEGAPVLTLLGAACRDPRAYPDPDRFDIARDGAPPPMSFGGGIHYCLGASLARAEGQIAFDRLLDRFPSIEPGWTAETPLRYRDSTILRGLEALPIRLS